MKKTLLGTFAILFIIVSSSYALETDTHELINEYIARNAFNGFSLDSYLRDQLNIDGIEEVFESNKVWQWLKYGGRYEDKPTWFNPYLRSVNHFHNPLTKEGFSGIWVTGFLSGESSIQWSQQPVETQSPGGHYSWHDVRGYFYSALTSSSSAERDESYAQTFRGLGQLMHLVQDMSVPAHTRNDGHYLYNYEKWVLKNVKNVGDYYPTYFHSSSIGDTNPLAAVPVANLFDTDQYNGSNPDISLQSNIGLSEYTNSNFFSMSTIFKDFPYHPSKESVLLEDVAIPDPRYTFMTVLRKYFNKVNDGDTGYRLAVVSFLEGFEDEGDDFCSEWFYENAYLDGEVYGDYAEKLIPRAVGYSADLLAYFFRGKIDMVVDDETGSGYVIENKSGEDMDGVFELYYDNIYNERIQIESGDFPFTTTISAYSKSSNIDFTVPDDAIEQDKYILVFKGKLGNEYEAVVGKVLKWGSFYLRVTINGHVPVTGGEYIQISNATGSQTETVAAGGLCGPFAANVEMGDATIAISYHTATGNYIFSHYEEVEEELAEIHLGYQFTDHTWDGHTVKSFDVGNGIDPLVHIKRVTWKEHESTLSVCTCSVEVIDGKSCPVYTVPFTGLYKLSAKRYVHKYYAGSNCAAGCGVSALPSGPILLDFNYPEWIGCEAPVAGYGDGVCIGSGDCECGYSVYIYSGIVNHFLPFTEPLTKAQLCILYNGNASFNGGAILTITSNIYVSHYWIGCGDPKPDEEGLFDCLLFGTDYSECYSYKFEMVETPESLL